MASAPSKDRSKGNADCDEITNLSAKIDATDEMKLKMLTALRSNFEDDLFPQELNNHLLDQLKVSSGENNDLRKCLFSKDQEIKELSNTVMELNDRIRDIISGAGPAISSKSAGIISSKITELCKQNRHLVADVEKYKTKIAALERKIMQMDILNKDRERLDVCTCKEELEVSPDELKELNSKLALVNRRLHESKNKNLELKNDILIATKILQQEMGDKFTSIKELQKDLSGWKGRAQQIVLLQARISELEEKLGKHKEIVEQKHKDQNQICRELEAKRKKEIDEAMKDVVSIKEDNKDLKMKLKAAKARTRNLECEMVLIKQKLKTFFDKSNHDDLLINEQRTRIKNLELYYQEILKENTMKMNKLRTEMNDNQKLMQNTDTKIEAIKKQSSERAAKIEELRAQLTKYEECSLQNIFFTPMKTANDLEIKKLVELVKTLNERLDNERHKWDDLNLAHGNLREKKKKLVRKLATLEDEINVIKTTRRGSKSVRVKAMDQQYVFDGDGGVSMTMKPSSNMMVQNKASESSTESSVEVLENLDKEELKYRLQLAEERIKMMEDRLRMVEEEKLEDIAHLSDMVQNSKQLFNEAINVLQKEKCMCS